MRLVVGPTCAGKSTYVERMQKAAIAEGRTLHVHLSYEIPDAASIPRGPDDIVHFNLLRGHLRRPAGPVTTAVSPLLPELIEAAEEIIVIGAPRKVLLRRAMERSNRLPEPEPSSSAEVDIEPSAAYPKLWCRALKMPKLAQIFEQLALHVDRSGKPHRYLCSNGDVHDDFHPISRWEFPRLAAADGGKLCRRKHPAPKLEVSGRTYQADFRQSAGGAGRAKTLSLALQMPLAGKRVLDIGCAEGAAALSAERMGARVTGIEPMRRRFRHAREIARTLGSRLDLRNTTLEELGEPDDSFDIVLALNVIHHQSDPFVFLNLAAALTSSHLVLEYPGLADRKYQSTLSERVEFPEDQPLMGVSLASQDQTFMFTPVALERYLLDTVAVFGRHEFMPSPIPGRWLSIFSDKKKAPPKPPKSEEAENLRRAVAARNAEIKRLKTELHAMRSSHSWRITKPLRSLNARFR